MTDSTKDYWRQWVSPGVILSVVGWLVLALGAWYRLGTLEKTVSELSVDVKASTQANNEAEKEAIRLQGAVENTKNRLDTLERFKSDQDAYNTKFLLQITELKLSKGGS